MNYWLHVPVVGWVLVTFVLNPLMHLNIWCAKKLRERIIKDNS